MICPDGEVGLNIKMNGFKYSKFVPEFIPRIGIEFKDARGNAKCCMVWTWTGRKLSGYEVGRIYQVYIIRSWKKCM